MQKVASLTVQGFVLFVDPAGMWIKLMGKKVLCGTVVELGRDSSRVPENMALVQWDIGLCQLHRAGHDGAFDLSVLDSSPLGEAIIKIKQC